MNQAPTRRRQVTRLRRKTRRKRKIDPAAKEIMAILEEILKLPALFVVLITFSGVASCTEIGITIKGVDDGIKTNKQQDYKEAVMNAKIEALERTGSELLSITKVENFQLKYDLIESRAEAVLLPGYQILDIGYQFDGTYLVILIGTLRCRTPLLNDPSELYNRSLLLIKQGQLEYADSLLSIIIDQHPGSQYSGLAFDRRKEIGFIFIGMNMEEVQRILGPPISKPVNNLRKEVNIFDIWVFSWEESALTLRFKDKIVEKVISRIY